MVKKTMKSKDGKYHIKGKTYEFLIGSRAQVMHGTAYKTNGGKDALKKEDLLKNKSGKIVSRKKHNMAKKEKRLEKYGYFTKKGKFGYVKKEGKKTKSKKTRRRRR